MRGGIGGEEKRTIAGDAKTAGKHGFLKQGCMKEKEL